MKNNSIVFDWALFLFICFVLATTSALYSDLSAQQAIFEEVSPDCSSVKASFEMDGDTGCAPLTVFFLNSSQNYISFEYDFGDDSTLTGAREESEQPRGICRLLRQQHSEDSSQFLVF